MTEDRPQSVDDRPDGIGQDERFELGAERSRFDPAQIEDLAHEAVEAVGFSVDRGGGRPGRSGVDTDLRVGQRPGGRPDAGKRRP